MPFARQFPWCAARRGTTGTLNNPDTVNNKASESENERDPEGDVQKNRSSLATVRIVTIMPHVRIDPREVIEQRLPARSGSPLTRAMAAVSEHRAWSAEHDRPFTSLNRNPVTSRDTPTTVTMRDGSAVHGSGCVGEVMSGSSRKRLTNGIAIRPEHASGRFRNYRDRIRLPFGRCEYATAQDRNAHHIEVRARHEPVENCSL
jgi:hypothetical protein